MKRNVVNGGKTSIVVAAAITLAVLFLLLRGFPRQAKQTLSQISGRLSGRVILLDPGHGGFDGGTVGFVKKAREADINLAVSLLLKQKLEADGADVIMTRQTDEALASEKRPDMEKRRELIRQSNADIVLSIHQNSHPESVNFGPQVFYAEGSEKGKYLAEALQQIMNEQLNTVKPRMAMPGDYFILKSGEMPCAIVESGFLSNPEEEERLLTREYQEKVADTVFAGVVKYFDTEKELD